MSLVPFEDIANTVLGIVNKFIPDTAQQAAAKAQIELAMQQAQATEAQAQAEVDKQEASNTNWFIAGARPFILWVCGAALVYQYILLPLGMWGVLLSGAHLATQPPSLDNSLWQLMFGLLGLGTMRTYEKMQGVQGKH